MYVATKMCHRPTHLLGMFRSLQRSLTNRVSSQRFHQMSTPIFDQCSKSPHSYSRSLLCTRRCMNGQSHQEPSVLTKTTKDIGSADEFSEVSYVLSGDENDLSLAQLIDLFQKTKSSSLQQRVDIKLTIPHLVHGDRTDSSSSDHARSAGANDVNIVNEALCNIVLDRIPTMSLEDISSLLENGSILSEKSLAAAALEHLLSRLDVAPNPTEIDQILSCLVSLSWSPFFTQLKSSSPSLVTTIARALQEDVPAEMLPGLMLKLAKLSIDFKVEPLPRICQLVFKNPGNYKGEKIELLAEFVIAVRARTTWYNSALLSAFYRNISKIESPSVFSRLSCSVTELASQYFRSRILERFEEFVEQTPHHFSVRDLISMLRASTSFDPLMRRKVLAMSSKLLLPLVSSMTVSDTVAYLKIVRMYQFGETATSRAALEKLEDNITQLTKKKDIVLAADMMSQMQISEASWNHLLQRLSTLGVDSPKEIAIIFVSAPRFCNQNPEYVALREMYLKLLPEISNILMLRRMAMFIMLKGAPKSSRVLLQDKLMKFSYSAITPTEQSLAVTALAMLGLNPQDMDPFFWFQVRKFLPNLRGKAAKTLLWMLGSSRFFKVSPVDQPELCRLQVDVFEKILRKTPPRHLLHRSERRTGHNSNVGIQSEGQESCSPINVGNAAGVSQFLYRTDYFFQDVVDQIVDVSHRNLEGLSTFELKDVIVGLSIWGSSHPGVEEICHHYARRLTFVEMLGPLFVLQGALMLARLQSYNTELLERIFCWKFLARLESMKPGPSVTDMLRRLNRAVCLDCPEMDMPWFHQTFHSEGNPRRGTSEQVKTEVYELLTDLLGGDRHVKTRCSLPYDYHADFVFKSDSLPEQCSPTYNERVAVDVLPSIAYFRNRQTKLKGEFAMKKRHLEMLGYKYIHISPHEWRRNLRYHSDRVDYLMKLIAGERKVPDDDAGTSEDS